MIFTLSIINAINIKDKDYDYVNNLIGESFLKPRIIVLLAVLFAFWLYLFLSMKLGNLSKNAEKKITYQYDNILYLWSVFYNKHHEKLNSNPWLIVMKTIRWSGKSKYIPNRKKIKETIIKIEDKLWIKVIPDDEWRRLSRLFRQYRIKKFFSVLLKSIIILIIVFLVILLICILAGKK